MELRGCEWFFVWKGFDRGLLWKMKMSRFERDEVGME